MQSDAFTGRPTARYASKRQELPRDVPARQFVECECNSPGEQSLKDDLDPFALGHVAVPQLLLQGKEACAVEQLPEIVRDLHQEIDVATDARLVAEIVLEAVAAVLLHMKAGLYVPASPPPLADVVRILQAGDVEARCELSFVRCTVSVVLGHPDDIEHMPVVRAFRDLHAGCPREPTALDPLPLRVMTDKAPGVRQILLHQVMRIREGLGRAPLLEGEDVLPAVTFAQLHDRLAGVEPVSKNADAEVWERRLEHGREAQEPVVLAVLLLVLVLVMPRLDRHGHNRVGGAPRRHQLRLEDIAVGSVAKPLAATDSLLLRPVDRNDEKPAEARTVEKLQSDHVADDVHERLLEHRRASPREEVAAAERAGSRLRHTLRPQPLIGELQDRVGVVRIVAVRVHRVPRPVTEQEPDDECPQECPPLVEAPLHVPRLADSIEERVQNLAEPGEERRQPFERRVAVRHFRRGAPDALPPAPSTGFATVLRPVRAVIASTSSPRAISLNSFSSRFASAQFADHAATS